MTNKEFVAVAVRIFAVFMAFYILRQLPYFSLYDLNNESIRLTLAYAVLSICVVVVLWFFPRSIASTLVAPHQESPATAQWTPSMVLVVGLILIGIFTLIQVLPDAAYWVSVVIIKKSAPLDDSLKFDSYAHLARLLIETILALWLVFGARGLVSHLDFLCKSDPK